MYKVVVSLGARMAAHQYQWFILYACVVVALSGVGLILGAGLPTALAPFSSHPFPYGLMLIGVTILTLRAMFQAGHESPHVSWRTLLMFVPLGIILSVRAMSVVEAIALGSYADGTLRPPLFIAADQVPVIATLIAYALSVLNLALLRNPHFRRHYITEVRSALMGAELPLYEVVCLDGGVHVQEFIATSDEAARLCAEMILMNTNSEFVELKRKEPA